MELDPRLRGENETTQRSGHIASAYPPASDASIAPAPYTLKPAANRQASSSSEQKAWTTPQRFPSKLPYAGAQRDSPQGGQDFEDEQLHTDPRLGSDQPHDDLDTPKRPRACEACRGLKVRCDFEPDAEVCKRCSKANRECIVTAPNRRRPKKADTRVADLERRIDDLTATLEAQKRISGSRKRHSQEADLKDGNFNGTYASTDSAEPDRKKLKASTDVRSPLQTDRSTFNGFNDRNMGAAAPLPPLTPGTPLINNEYSDAVDRGILNNTDAMQLFGHYAKNMQKHLPCVVFSQDTSAGQIRKTKPALYLALLSVAAGNESADLQRVLNRELSKSLADRIMIKREKSLELVQAMQVTTAWHNSEDPNDTMAFQYIQTASAMAMAMELSGGPSRGQGSKHLGKKPPALEEIERKRAWLSCYLLSGTSSFPLRQQNSIRWTPFLSDCLITLRTVPGISYYDKFLCRWVELQHYCDQILDISTTLPSTGSLGINAMKEMQAIVAKIGDIAEGAEAKSDFSLRLASHEIESICLLTIAKIGDGKPNFVPSNAERGGPQLLTEDFTKILRSCVGSIHRLLDEFTLFLDQYSLAQLNALPSFHFSRIAYALISLLCIYFGANSPKSKLTNVLGPNDIHVNHYMMQLLDRLRSNKAEEARRPSQKLHLIIKMLKAWYERASGGRKSQHESGAIDSLQVQPVDEEQTTPRLGYRKLSVHSGQPLEADMKSAPRAPTSRRLKGDLTPAQSLEDNIPTGNTPLDLLSQVATNAPTVQDTTAYGTGWYDNEGAYQPRRTESNHATGSDLLQGDAPGWAGLMADPALEEAMGMAFGSEGNMFGAFVDDLVSSMHGEVGDQQYPNWLMVEPDQGRVVHGSGAGNA